MKYLVPLEHDKGVESHISMHFGKAPYYAIVTFNPSNGNVEVDIKPAPSLLHGEVCDASTLASGVDAIIVKGVGPRAIHALESLGVKIYTTNAQVLGEAIKEITGGSLTPLNPSSATCRHRDTELRGYQCRGFHYPFPIAPPLGFPQQAFTQRRPTVRVAIASVGREGLNDQVAPQFGRCPTFTIVDVVNGGIVNVEVRDNIYAMQPHGAGFAVVQFLAGLGVNIVVGSRFGPNASQALASLGIQVQTVPAGTRVKDALRFLTG